MMRQKSDKAIAASLIAIMVVWLANGLYLGPLSRYSVAAFWSADLLQWIFLPALLAGYLATKHHILPHHYGFSASLFSIKTLAWGALTTLTFFPAYFWIEEYTRPLFGWSAKYFALESVYPGGGWGTVVWIYSAMTAGVVESIFFIGLPWLLWSRYRQGKVLLFSCISSLVFASAHWEQGPHVVAGALAFNLVACAWYLRLKNLWPVVIGHVTVDLIALG